MARSARQGSVSIVIDAPPEKVWSRLAELDRMGDWSPECLEVRWLDGASSPARPGARFVGRNRYGWLRWSMACQVQTADPGRELSWTTVKGGRDLVRWTYRLEPEGPGTRLTESFEVIVLPPVARLAEDVLMRDRDRRRELAMTTTLERIKKVVEDPVGGPVRG